MTRQELRDGMPVILSWPNDDPEEALIYKTVDGFGVRVETQSGEILWDAPRISDNLIAVMEPHATA